MKAIQATRFGGPDVLKLVELPDPVAGPGQLLVDVRCSAVGLIDALFRKGTFEDRPGFPRPPFIPGLEVAGTVRALGEGVTGFSIGERVVTFSTTGTGGYASVAIADPAFVVSLEGHAVELETAVATIPNAAMACLALARVARLSRGESVLVHGALGGFASAFPGVARELGASRVVGSVRSAKLAAASSTRLPYDRIVDSAQLIESLQGERFDVVVDPVGGDLRTRSLDMLRPGGRLLLVGNASGDWAHVFETNRLWLGSITVSGFSAGAYVPTHAKELRAAVDVALAVSAKGLVAPELEVLPLEEAARAHERMESHSLRSRVVLAS